MNTNNRYGLVTWPESQEFVGNPDCILVAPPDDDMDLDCAYLVPEDITGPLAAGSAYVRLSWPESQGWDAAPEGADKDDVLHDYDTMDAYVLETLYEKEEAA